MGSDVAVVGDIENAKGWRKRSVDAERQRLGAKAFREAAVFPDAPAADVIRTLDAEGVFRVVEQTGELQLRGIVPSEVFGERARQIVGLVAALAGDDAEGEVLVVGVGAAFGHRIAIADGGVKVTKLRAAEAALLESDARVVEAIRLAGNNVDALVGRVEPTAPAPAVRPDAPPQPELASMLAELRADPIASLREGPEPHFGELVVRAAPLRRLVNALAAARYEPAHPTIAAIWREHPWPFIRAGVERAALSAGVPEVVRAVAARLESEAARTDADGARTMTAAEATVLLDPKTAVERLSSHFQHAKSGDPIGVAVTQSVLGLLALAGESAPAFAEQAARSREWLDADRRWRDVAFDVVQRRSDSAIHSAIAILRVTGDPRGPSAVVDALAREVIDVAAAQKALRDVRDGALADRLREEARRRKGRKAEAKALDDLAKRVSSGG